jgi:hypothetical protein
MIRRLHRFKRLEAELCNRPRPFFSQEQTEKTEKSRCLASRPTSVCSVPSCSRIRGAAPTAYFHRSKRRKQRKNICPPFPLLSPVQEFGGAPPAAHSHRSKRRKQKNWKVMSAGSAILCLEIARNHDRWNRCARRVPSLKRRSLRQWTGCRRCQLAQESRRNSQM